MGFNKRIIHKENINSNIRNIEFIVKLANADALIMDYWSSSFYDNLNFNWEKYQNIRTELLSETAIYSDLNKISNNPNFNKLKNLSNIYYNLNNDPSWLDILLTNSIIEIDIPNDKSGKFIEMVEICIYEINKKYQNG